jgi:hypothetical protein
VANAVMLHNVVDMTNILHDLQQLDSRKFSVLGLASVQPFNTGKVHPTAPCKHPEKAPPFTAPRKS